MKLLSDPKVQVIVVEHRDRLARFGAEYIEAVLAASGRKLVVVDAGEMKDDLVQDMIDVLTSFCARLYGRRSAKNLERLAASSAVTACGEDGSGGGLAPAVKPASVKQEPNAKCPDGIFG